MYFARLKRRLETVRWRSVFWAWVAWTAYGLTSGAVAHYVMSGRTKPYTWPTALISEITYVYVAAFLSPFVIQLADRFRLEPPKRLRHVAIHILVSVAFGAGTFVLFQGLMYLSGRFEAGMAGSSSEFRAIIWHIPDAGMLYWVMLFVHSAGYYYRRYESSVAKAADLNAQLAQAQLQSLKMQLHPHFLFNALHSISELIHADPSAAERMVVGLSDLLRRSLANSSTLEVTLKTELELTQLYLDIEKMRFDDRLWVEIRVDEEIRQALVPNLILQPLVENAIKHGISRRPGQGCLVVEASRSGDILVIVIRDNGAGLNTEKGPIVEGVGLSTTRARLEKLYGTRQSFHFVRRPGGTEAVMRLPFRMEATEVVHDEHITSANSGR